MHLNSQSHSFRLMSAFPQLESSDWITWEERSLPPVMSDVVHGAAVEGHQSPQRWWRDRAEACLPWWFVWSVCCQCVFLTGIWFGVEVSARANLSCGGVLICPVFAHFPVSQICLTRGSLAWCWDRPVEGLTSESHFCYFSAGGLSPCS